ncbi:serine/threonine-protein kinase [Luteipulveratus flavus]|uniref:non-specific serine/threonine protein kinase n=1 Tax=Luteipulveratus flavus TaxID=3031728 RepID=A0ABT6C4T2_9MICO|nr:serine/threonine-protein kinase [Luteipulveratus sp. YIM 133296]MDF8263959.1 protein kinase [Luteipulveratus sp. YIM 133296]
MSTPAKDTTMGGRYTLTDRIAAGGMGEVWKARDDILGRTVALKVLKAGLTDETGFTERFRNEARLSAALTHGNIASVYDYGEDEGTAYLVMEFVPGRPLSKIIEQRAPMSPIDTVEIISQAAAALQAAHKNGLIHRDVKPANILIDPDGTAKLTDFGIARAVGSVAMTKTGEVMGTAQYLAPESAMGRPSTNLSDVYALGVVAYEMLAGRRPFEADTAVALALAHVNEPPPPLPPFVPPTIRAVVAASLEKDPGRRPGSAAEFGRAMRQALRDADRMGMLRQGPPPGPQGPGQRLPSSGPQPTGARPAAPSGPQHVGPPSGPNRSAASSGPNPQAARSGPQRVGPPSGPNTQAGHRPGHGSGPNPQVGPNQQPNHQQQRPVGASSGQGSSPDSGQVTRSRLKTQPESVKSTRQQGPVGASGRESGSPVGWARNKGVLIGSVIGALVLIGVLVAVLTSGGGGTPTQTRTGPGGSPLQTGPFKTPFSPVD